MLIHGNKNNFEKDVLNNKKVVLVDFYADWCGPCKMIAPVLEKISKENDAFDIVKVNVEENQELSYQYQIQSIPTLLIFKEGTVVEKIIGFTGEEHILSTINKYIQ